MTVTEKKLFIGVPFFPGILYLPLSHVRVEQDHLHALLKKSEVVLGLDSLQSLIVPSQDYNLLWKKPQGEPVSLHGILLEWIEEQDDYKLRFQLTRASS